MKTMLIQFFNSKGVVCKEFVLESWTVTEEFYLEVLGHLLKQIACVRPEVWKNRSFNLFHNYASAHTTIIVQQLLAKKKKGSSA